MANDPSWYESRSKISIFLVEGLIRKFQDSPVLTQERTNLLMSISSVNSFSSEMLEINRPAFYDSLKKVGTSEEDIGSIPLFEGYDHEGG